VDELPGPTFATSLIAAGGIFAAIQEVWPSRKKIASFQDGRCALRIRSSVSIKAAFARLPHTQKELPKMNAAIPQVFGTPRFPLEREPASLDLGRPGRLSYARPAPDINAHAWLVDLTALAYCRALLSRQALSESQTSDQYPVAQQTMMDVPASYDEFCRTHFSSVKRLHPELNWDDACPAYAIALSAHALLCEGLDGDRETLLEANWPRIRGQSNLDWKQARTLIADGCSALARLDPLAMRR
jgi:hypothetical protein